MYIHPSNRYLKPGEVEPAWNAVSKTHNIDWYWNGLLAKAINYQECSRYSYHLANYLSGISRADTMDEARLEAFRARANLFLLIGDGTPWTDPDGKLTLWEGAL